MEGGKEKRAIEKRKREAKNFARQAVRDRRNTLESSLDFRITSPGATIGEGVFACLP